MTPTTVECGHRKCNDQVIPVSIMPSMKIDYLDPEVVTWQEGGRYRLVAHQPNPARLLATLVTAGHSFGVKLRRRHAETCKGAQRHTRQRARSS